MDVPLAINDIVICPGLKGYKVKSSSISHKIGVEGLFYVFICLVLMSGCSTQKSKYDELGVPVGELASVIDEFESRCDNYSDWKLESDDYKLTIYTIQDSLEGYPSKCLVLYHDGNETKAVSEEVWRKKYGIKDHEHCPLFSNGHRRLYTIENKLKKDAPVYVLVTEDLLEKEYSTMDGEIATDGMCIYAHAYTIQDGQLQPKEVFCSEGKYSYITECDTTMWVEWLSDIPSIWPAQYDKQTRSLEIIRVETFSILHSLMYDKNCWRYDDKLGFMPVDEPSITENYINEMSPYIVAKSELFPKHKIQVNYDGNYEYQYASWPADSTWTSEPSIVVTGGLKNEKDGSICFKSKDGYEYVVFLDTHPEGYWPSLSALEVHRNGKVIYREEAEH